MQLAVDRHDGEAGDPRTVHDLEIFGTVAREQRDARALGEAERAAQRRRAMRGKRVATPLLWRVDICRPSNASSNTCTGSTRRTGPKRSSVWLRIQLSTARISASDNPEYAFAKGTSSPSSPRTANV